MKKKIIIINILMLAILMITQRSFAAIEIKPSDSADSNGVMKNTSVSNSYLLCQNMTKQGESLYGSTVLPHLATNSDWGAVSYLSNSIYGTNTAGQNTGTEVTINGVTYYSTNGNVTGVMNWGINYYTSALYTQTASLITAYVTDNSESTAIDYVTELLTGAKSNSRFVEIINTGSFTVANTLGQALAETSGYNYSQSIGSGTSVNYPIAVRKGLFGFYVGYGYEYSYIPTSGAGSAVATFRPVVWNK